MKCLTSIAHIAELTEKLSENLKAIKLETIGNLTFLDWRTSTFCLPYANLGQTTEGGLALAAKCSNIPDVLVMSNHYVKYLKKKY